MYYNYTLVICDGAISWLSRLSPIEHRHNCKSSCGAELFVYLGSTDERISQKGTETSIGRAPVACCQAQEPPSRCQQGFGAQDPRPERNEYIMTREGAWPTPLASWVSPPSLAQASWVRLERLGLTPRKASPRVRPATAPTLSKSATRLERLSVSRTKSQPARSRSEPVSHLPKTILIEPAQHWACTLSLLPPCPCLPREHLDLIPVYSVPHFTKPHCQPPGPTSASVLATGLSRKPRQAQALLGAASRPLSIVLLFPQAPVRPVVRPFFLLLATHE